MLIPHDLQSWTVRDRRDGGARAQKCTQQKRYTSALAKLLTSIDRRRQRVLYD